MVVQMIQGVRLTHCFIFQNNLGQILLVKDLSHWAASRAHICWAASQPIQCRSDCFPFLFAFLAWSSARSERLWRVQNKHAPA